MPLKKTAEEFIKRAREVHGDKYDYSKVEYVNAKTKVCIICPEHGEFWQTPYNHLKGCECKQCSYDKIGDRSRLRLEEFVEKASMIHNGKYDYSKVNYVNSETEVCIICPEHGEFWQKPIIHTTGHGCPKCKQKYKCSSTAEFIKRARMVHGDKYDYTQTDYKSASEKVIVVCQEHGPFLINPSDFLRGAGCPKCAGKGMNTEDFIKKARIVHGEKYDYSHVEYKKSTQKVCIICETHGEFWQTPSSHLRGTGCPYCGRGTYFLKSDKLSLLNHCDLLYMDWACILDLVSEDKLPKEFSQLATFAAGSKGRKKLIDELSKKYSIPESGDDADNEEEETSAEQATNDTKIATDDEIISATIPLPSEQTKHATIGGIMHEIDTIASIIQRGDKTTYSSGDKMKHIVAKELSKLWSQVLRDDENHSTETITEIKKQIK